jgi:hypothetical protein
MGSFWKRYAKPLMPSRKWRHSLSNAANSDWLWTARSKLLSSRAHSGAKRCFARSYQQFKIIYEPGCFMGRDCLAAA